MARSVVFRWSCSVILLCALAAAGCSSSSESVLHSGENASLTVPGTSRAYAAVTLDAEHELTYAVETQNDASLQELVKSGRVLETEQSVPVKITGEFYEKRRLEFLDGAHKGQTGWTPVAWLSRQQPSR